MNVQDYYSDSDYGAGYNSDDSNGDDGDDGDNSNGDKDTNNGDKDNNNNDNGNGNDDDDDSEDPLPWDREDFWCEIYSKFPHLTTAQLFVQGFLDRKDQKDTQYLQISRRILHFIHKTCPDLREFGIYCARPKCLYFGGNSVPVRLVYKREGESKEWELKSHMEQLPGRWKEHVKGAENLEDD